MLCEPLVTVKHSCQKMPFAPSMSPVDVFVPVQSLVSGNFCLKYESSCDLSCWSFCGGRCWPLPTVMEPSPFGLCTVMLWSSLLFSVQTLGMSTDSAAFDSVPFDVPP